MRLSLEPVQVPVYLATLSPKMLELTGEIADGWLGIFFAPEQAELSLASLRAGREKAGLTLDGFDIAPNVPIAVSKSDSAEDIAAAADIFRSYTALYVGGMGSREQNFYNRIACRMGYEQAAQEIQDKYLAKDYAGAAAAVPQRLIDSTVLVGTRERIADRLRVYADAGVTTLNLSPGGFTLSERITALRTAAEAVELAGLG
jgi:alkanesulfonate monooxygenase SsuD/methylene tetrahydromethanopterin reductase-like flavin-dependent oxidoreductase (luciferase family)